MKTIIVNYSGKKIPIEISETGFFRKAFGLMLRGRNTSNLVFDFDEEVYKRGSLTGLFVFFPFLVLWLDEKNNVLEWRVCRPFEVQILPRKKFWRIIEVPVNQKNEKILHFFVEKKEKFKY